MVAASESAGTGAGPSGRGRLVELEIDNFKSYRGHIQVPFRNFTAVIGPNGSGKSNLMDAISFVLGVRTAQLRGSLKELLFSYSEGTTQADHPTTGGVSLTFEDPEGRAWKFSRRIVGSAQRDSEELAFSSRYGLDGRTVTWEAYNAKLESFGILVKAKNFLVFQGEIETVATESDMALARRFEIISGSLDLKPEYDEAKAAAKAAGEAYEWANSKRKAAHREKREKKGEKDEAEAFQAQQAELDGLRQQYMLWQLRCVVSDARAVRERMAEGEAKLAELDEAVKEADAAAAAHARATGSGKKARILKEKAIKKIRLQIENQTPVIDRIDAELESLVAPTRRAERELKAKQQKAEAKKQRIENLETELSELQDARATLEEELEAERRKAGVRLSEAQMTEYDKLKAETAAQTADDEQERKKLLSRHQAEAEPLERKREHLSQLRSEIGTLEAERGSLEERLAAAKQSVASLKGELKEGKKAKQQTEETIRKCGAQRDHLAARLRTAEEALNDLRADRKENARSRKSREAVQAMRAKFPGVYGRVMDLGRVVDSSWNLALAVVMGKNMEAVVVDNQSTGRRCMEFMREEKIPSMSFIPLQEVRVKPASDALRRLGGTARLALDLMEYDAAVEAAFLFALGNTLVCRDIGEAKGLAWYGAERRKVVTRDGTLLAKNGNITGGGSASMDAKAAQFNEAAAADLQRQVQHYQTELDALPTARDAHAQDQELRVMLEDFGSKLQLASRDVSTLTAKLKAADEQLAKLKDAVESEGPAMERMQAEAQAREGRIEELQDKINVTADKLCAKFSKKVGVPNIREAMEAHKVLQARELKEHAKLDAQEISLQQKIEGEKRTNFEDAAGRLRKTLKMTEARRKKLLEEKEGAQSAIASAEEDAAAQEEELNRMKEAEAEAAGEASRLRKAVATKQQAAGKVRREEALLEAQLQEHRNKQESLLESASHASIAVPVREAGARAALPVEGQEGEAATEVDFGELQAQYRGRVAAAERPGVKDDFENTLNELTAALAAVNPNLKAAEQYGVLLGRERELTEEADKALAESNRTSEAFARISETRRELFETAFTEVSNAIGPIYRDLTWSTTFEAGGHAGLALKDAEGDEPWDAGVIYTIMPPGKRFRSMDLLSGGEKTLAALALLFAIHCAAPSPFFVLDEVDAALDATNVARVARYIRSRSRADRGDDGTQAIVISLKDLFYDKADGLVGVCRDGSLGCSQVLTFDLNRYGDIPA